MQGGQRLKSRLKAAALFCRQGCQTCSADRLSNPPLLNMLAFFLGSKLQVEVRLGAKRETTQLMRQYLCQSFLAQSSGFSLLTVFQNIKKKVQFKNSSSCCFKQKKSQDLTHSIRRMLTLQTTRQFHNSCLTFMICICHAGSSLGYKLQTCFFCFSYIDLQF